MTKIPCSFFTKGADSCHNCSESGVNRVEQSIQRVMRRGVVWFRVDSGCFCTTVVSRSCYQKVDIVIFSAFRWIHRLYYNLLPVQLRNS